MADTKQGMTSAAVADFSITFLRQLPELMAAGIDVYGSINAHRQALEKMKAENRDPTPDEWATLNERLNNDTRRLQGARTDGR
jgi:hypothetical protein